MSLLVMHPDAETRAETSEDQVRAPQKVLFTELVAGPNVNRAKKMYICTRHRSDSSMQRSCMKLMVSIVLASFQLFARVQEPKSRRYERKKP